MCSTLENQMCVYSGIKQCQISDKENIQEQAMFAFMTGVLNCIEIFMKSHSASNTDMPCNVYF